VKQKYEIIVYSTNHKKVVVKQVAHKVSSAPASVGVKNTLCIEIHLNSVWEI
jgi:hypothetical protein